MRIKIDKSVANHESGTFWAGIYVEHDTFAFPERIWDDIAFGVLQEWGVQCQYLIENEGEKLTMSFFDGPYYLNCSRQGDSLIVECVNDGSPPKVERTLTGSIREFLSSYVLAFDELHDAYLNLNLSSDDRTTEERSIDSCRRSKAVFVDHLRSTSFDS